MMNEMKDKLKTLGWQPIEPSKLSKDDIGKTMYNVFGEKVWIKVPNLNTPEVFDYKQFSNYSFTPPTIEISLVAMGFGYNNILNMYEKIIHNKTVVLVDSNAFKAFNYSTLLPNVKDIPTLKKAIDYLTFLFVEK